MNGIIGVQVVPLEHGPLKTVQLPSHKTGRCKKTAATIVLASFKSNPQARLIGRAGEVDESVYRVVELTPTHKYGMVLGVKTARGLPDSLFRETKALAARKGLSLRQVVVEALALKLKAEKEMPEAKTWLRAFRDLKPDDDLLRELRQLSRRIAAEFERVTEEDWK